VFILYAIPLGFLLGLLLLGRPSGLATVRIAWAPLIVLGLLVQVVLFTDPVPGVVGELGAPIYVASNLVVLAAILVNVRIPGMSVVALGAGCNQLAIIANGGYMPASAAALAAQGRVPLDGYSNSALLADPAFPFLTDIIALPTWLPFTNIISVGDVLIGLGIALTIALAMRRGRPTDSPAVEESVPA
jgi:hypothetical protein